MGNKKEQRLLVERYCIDPVYEGYKDLPLAKLIFKENRSLFLRANEEKSIDYARGVVRIVRGHSGKKNREGMTDKSMVTPLTYDTTNWTPPAQVTTGAKVLVLDIETAPLKVFVWNVWNQNVSTNQIVSDWFCLTWAAKWLFEDKVFSGKLTPKEVADQNDSRIIKGIWEMVNEADIVIAHNGDKFDMPRLNSRFIINGLNPPLPYQSIDTLKHIRRQFAFVHNKLDYVNQILHLERKQDTGGFELWVNCLSGDETALNKMEDYNVKDVRILESTYLRILPWIKPHPNMGLFILDETQERCPTCGSNELEDQAKNYHTTMNVYQLCRCKNCGAASRKRLSDVKIKKRRFLRSSVPR